ncbi:MAG TPA: carbon-nitrogen hydrolase family protein [Alphaproteobacteria bacterium]|nr:carbon-nitrogen hydrolase family protein [Alphaproteobacteria bacterium]
MAETESQPFRLACVQVNAGDNMTANLAAAEAFARQAKDQGAALIGFPENVAFMAPDGIGVREAAAPEETHPALAHFQGLARELDAWLLVGSLAVATNDADGRVANRTFLLDGDGKIRARYDKIHMFDVQLSGGESYKESSTYRPGGDAVLASTPFGQIGLTICYDLRFPYLYRALAHAGAQLIAVPSAFTLATGRAHWQTLLRARAIETGCFVFAPAQCGTHPRGRKTYGHSIIIGPWGEVLAAAGDEPGVITAEIDLAASDRARAQVPSLTHDRNFTGP